MKIKVRYAHLEFDEVELEFDHEGDIDDIDEDGVLAMLEKQQGLGEDAETDIIEITGVVEEPPHIVDFECEDDGTVSVDWSDGKVEVIQHAQAFAWLAAGQQVSR